MINEFVMVPREPTDEMIVAFAEAWYSKRQCIDDPDMLDAYAAMLAVAPEHQGEPVAWVRFRNGEPDYDGDACMIMNVPGDTLGDGDSWEPLYTHADPGEVERLAREKKMLRSNLAEVDRISDEIQQERDALRAKLAELEALHGGELGLPKEGWPEYHKRKMETLRELTAGHYERKLAERDALLREALPAVEYESGRGDAAGSRYLQLADKIKSLSASAEPSAPKSSLPGVRYIDNHSWPLPHLRADNCIFKGKNADGSDPFRFEVCADGSRRLVMVNMVGWVCSGPMQDEPSAPVERDERAEFESWCAVIGYTLKTSEHGNGFKPGYGSELFSAWKARAALERKPPTTPRDAFAAWEPTGNPIRGVNGRLAAKAGFDAGWCAGWTECRADMERKP